MPNQPIKFKRTPGTLTVGNQTITIDAALRAGNASGSPARPKAPSAGGTAIPGDRPMTPISPSNAVPPRPNATQQVVKSGEASLGRIDAADAVQIRKLLSDVAESIDELQSQHRQSLGEMQEVAVELATAAASWLVGAAIEKEYFAVDDLILKAFEHLDLSQPVTVRLNPADHDLLQKLMTDPASSQQLKQVACVKDETLSRGAVRVESGRRILLTDMNSRLEQIRRSWMEKLNDTQIERRGDDAASGTLRRFPERRETA